MKLLKIVSRITLAAIVASGFVAQVQAADAAAGKAKAAVCAGCHGPDGKGLATPIPGQPISPKIAGQFEDYLSKSMTDYKTGARKDALMGAIAAGLSDEDIANIAAYFASL